MNRQTQELIEAVKELDVKFDEWVSYLGDAEQRHYRQIEMAKAVGKVKGLAYILEHETRPFSSFQHSEHLYGTKNSQG